MSALLLAVALQGVRILMDPLPGSDGTPERLQTYYRESPLPQPKLSPKKFPPLNEAFTFDWVAAGFVKLREDTSWRLRFRVYPQTQPKGPQDITFSTTRTLLRLWEIADSWGLDHQLTLPDRVVDVYLCWGGVKGGEQLFDHDPQVPRGENDLVNTIYIYDLPSFEGEVERLREVAHEYGHAILPALGGYSDPESWGNGILGERIFLRRLLSLLKEKRVPARDMMDVSIPALEAWVVKNVDAPARIIATEGPDSSALRRKDGIGMGRTAAFGAYLETILPPRTFGRTLRLMDLDKPESLIKAAALAANEPDQLTMTVPAFLRKAPIWIPIGSGRLTNATILAKKSGWAKIRVGVTDPVLTNRRS
ncbi:MAG: hypothetical protein C4320_00675 [Armatimonadota bacterium]